MKKRIAQAMLVSAMIPSMLTTSVAPSVGHEDNTHNNKEIKLITQTEDQTNEQDGTNYSDLTKVRMEKIQARANLMSDIDYISITNCPVISDTIESQSTDQTQNQTADQEEIKKRRKEKIKEKRKKERERKICEYQDKVNTINVPNRKEWFVQYKQLQEEYAEWIDKDKTIYDQYSPEELELLFRIVETEVRGDCYFDEKSNVVSVIFNRLKIDNHDWFPDTLTGVLTEYPQFSSYLTGAYQYVTVTETTKLACEYVYQFGDVTGGALWFDSTDGNSWADRNRHLLFKDYVGHAYYN